MAADAAGNTYVTGLFTHNLLLGSINLPGTPIQRALVAKYAPDGRVLWAQALSCPNAAPFVYRVATDGAGNVYLTGTFEESLTIGTYTLTDPAGPVQGAQQLNGFVLKLDAQGAPQWALRMGPLPNGPLSAANCNGLAVDAGGQVTIAGYFLGTVSVAGQLYVSTPSNLPRFYVARLSGPAGAVPTVQWMRTAEAPGLRFDSALALDGTGSVYAALSNSAALTFGPYPVPATGDTPQGVLVKYDATGTEQWATRLPDVMPQTRGALPNVVDVVASAAGGACVAFQSVLFGAVLSREMILAQYSAQGTAGWHYATLTNNDNTGIGGLALDAGANVYVVGGYSGAFALGGNIMPPTTTPAADGYLLSFSWQGSPRYALPLTSGAGDEIILAAAVGAAGTLHVAGLAEGAAQLGPNTLPPIGTDYELLAGRLRGATLTSTQPATAPALQLAPNPAYDFAQLTLPAAATLQPFALLDALGRPVRRYSVPAGATTARLDVAGLPAGLYVLRGAGASRKLVLE